MADKKKYDFTSEGINNLKEELDRRKGTERTEIANRIKEARSFGDLSENSEYDDAKEAQALNEAKIVELEDLLKNANVIEDHEISKHVIGLGSKVTLEDIKSGEQEEFTLVSQKEEDIFSSKISTESPVGVAIMGKKKGDKITVSTPVGLIKYTVVKIG